MKITIEYTVFEKCDKVTIETSGDNLAPADWMVLFRKILYFVGFDNETINEYIDESVISETFNPQQ